MGAVPVFIRGAEWRGTSTNVFIQKAERRSALTCSDMCPIRQPRGLAIYADLSPARLQLTGFRSLSDRLPLLSGAGRQTPSQERMLKIGASPQPASTPHAPF